MKIRTGWQGVDEAWGIVNGTGKLLLFTVVPRESWCVARLLAVKHNQTWEGLKAEGYRVARLKIEEVNNESAG